MSIQSISFARKTNYIKTKTTKNNKKILPNKKSKKSLVIPAAILAASFGIFISSVKGGLKTASRTQKVVQDIANTVNNSVAEIAQSVNEEKLSQAVSEALSNSKSAQEAVNTLQEAIASAGEAMQKTGEAASEKTSEAVQEAIASAGEAASEKTSEAVQEAIASAGEAASEKTSEAVQEAIASAGEAASEKTSEAIEDKIGQNVEKIIILTEETTEAGTGTAQRAITFYIDEIPQEKIPKGASSDPEAILQEKFRKLNSQQSFDNSLEARRRRIQEATYKYKQRMDSDTRLSDRIKNIVSKETEEGDFSSVLKTRKKQLKAMPNELMNALDDDTLKFMLDSESLETGKLQNIFFIRLLTPEQLIRVQADERGRQTLYELLTSKITGYGYDCMTNFLCTL
ncbi:MAG: hypothetical protein IJ877_01390 [Candidatus Gastranaerophilales bacterium]|nr:hypothetical protein [Candidatus Gastranaerophilales bacterium]